MAAKKLPSYPELTPFLIPNDHVELTGTKIGAGAYGSVEEVKIRGTICAVKKMHDFFKDNSQLNEKDIKKASIRFVEECQLMSTLLHPNIVQFLGVTIFADSQLPALVMERLLTSLHDLLAPDTPPPPGRPKPFFPPGLKCSILHNVACGLAYLHGLSPPVIHRDLSARNVLLNSAMVAKVADLGVARILSRVGGAATMTKAPGAAVYMPPEALENKPGEEKKEAQDKKSKYDASIDIFSFGVVAIFTLSHRFPCDLLAPNYRENGRLLGRTELQRRESYMRIIYNELHEDHALVRMIKACLDFPEDRPHTGEVLRLLEEARAETRDAMITKNRLELMQDYKSKGKDLAEAHRRLQRKEERLQCSKNANQELAMELCKKETELTTMAEEAVKREKRLMEEMKKQEAEVVKAKDDEIAELHQQIWDTMQKLTERVETMKHDLDVARMELIEKEIQLQIIQLRTAESFVQDIILQLTKSVNTSGPGLTTATVNQPTHVLVELTDSSGQSYLLQLNVTAKLELVSEATPTCESKTSVTKVSSTQYKVSITAANRGTHKLHVTLNNQHIEGSPFSMTIYPNPTQLRHPVRVMENLNRPCGIAFNARGEMIVTEFHADKLSTFCMTGKDLQKSPSLMGINHPRGVAIDDMDNIYVSSKHQLQKFASDRERLKCIGQKGKKEGEFHDPEGVTAHGDRIYVCDSNNHRIQVFDRDLSFIESIGSRGQRNGEFNTPRDVQFDAAGNMYVAEFGNKRVQVRDADGKFTREFGEGKLLGPSGLLIIDKYVYVSDYNGSCIFVFDTSGQFVTSFGKEGTNEGEFLYPSYITSFNGFIYICDCHNDRVQIY